MKQLTQGIAWLLSSWTLSSYDLAPGHPHKIGPNRGGGVFYTVHKSHSGDPDPLREYLSY